MTSLGIIRALGAVAAAVALFLLAWGWAARQRRRRARPARAASGDGEAAHRLELRLAALERAQGDLAARLEGAGGAEERLQATAGQLLGLVRDKNATTETALAGLDQLRGRMRVLEQLGDAAEARGLFERLGERLAAVEAAAAARGGDGAPAALVEELRRLHLQKDAAVEAVLGRLGPVEARLEALGREVSAADPAVERLAAAVEAVRLAQATLGAGIEARLGALEAPGESPFAAVSEQLTRLYAQKDAAVEAVLGRLGPVEARLEALGREVSAADPAVERLAAAVEAVRLAQATLGAGIEARLGALEAPGESPFAAVSEQLTRLYAQKDAAVEAVLGRLGPVEARLEALVREVSAADPAVERLSAAVEAVRLAQAGVLGRLGALETPGESPFAAVSEQLTRLYAQKDAATGAVLARLGEVEAQAAAMAAAGAALGERVGALEAPGSPLAAISEQLARLYAQKDAAAAAVAARLAPVEAGLAVLGQAVAAGDPAVARLAQGLEAARDAQARAAVRLGERLSALEQAADTARAEGRAAEDAARAAAQAVAGQLVALRAAAAETELFADRLALLEASLPRLSPARAERMQQRLPAPPEPAAPAAPAPAAPDADPLAAVQDLPGVVSLHR